MRGPLLVFPRGADGRSRSSLIVGAGWKLCAVPLKVGEIIKLIEADGWYLVAVRGSHRQFKHPTKLGRVTVPGKPSRELYPELERSILKQAGLPRRKPQ